MEVSEDDLLSAVTADNINAQGIVAVPQATEDQGTTVLHTPSESETAQVSSFLHFDICYCFLHGFFDIVV